MDGTVGGCGHRRPLKCSQCQTDAAGATAAATAAGRNHQGRRLLCGALPEELRAIPVTILSELGTEGGLFFPFRNCPRAWTRQLPVVFLPFLVVSARYVLRRYSVPSTKAWPRSLTSESFLPVLLAGRRLLWSRILHLPNHTWRRGSPSLDERMSQRS